MKKVRKVQPKLGLLLGLVAGAMVLALVIGVLIYGIVLKNGKTIYQIIPLDTSLHSALSGYSNLN